MKLFLLCNLLLASGLVNAAGNGHGSPVDLIPAFINLGILFAVLAYFLKTPAKNYYQDKSENVKSVLERASVKAKEAEMMMEAQRKKINGVADEIDRIYQDTEKNIATFKDSYTKEIDERIAKTKDDAAQKIEAEKTEQINKLNSNFLDEVIAKAKSFIKNNPELGSQATEKVLEALKK